MLNLRECKFIPAPNVFPGSAIELSKSGRYIVHITPPRGRIWTVNLLYKTTIMTTTANSKVLTTREVAERFNELAQQEKWFEIQDEFFSENVKSIDPPDSPYMGYAEGKAAVEKKGRDFVSKIEGGHRFYTSAPIVSENHFAVTREMDITLKGHGRVLISEIMLYEVRDGKIVVEQFFY